LTEFSTDQKTTRFLKQCHFKLVIYVITIIIKLKFLKNNLSKNRLMTTCCTAHMS